MQAPNSLIVFRYGFVYNLKVIFALLSAEKPLFMKKTPIKKFGALPVSFLLVFIQTSSVFASFTDVPENYPQGAAIEVLQLRNVISGYADKTFKPDKLITRGEFLKMAFNDVGYKRQAISDITPFVDVPSDNWTAPYVKKALEISIITANGQNPTFNPTAPITRAEAVRLAFPIAGIATPYYTDIDPLELYQDVRPNAWYAYLARAAKLNGIATVKKPDFFWANHLMTRGDAAELIYEIQTVRELNQQIYGGVIITGPGPLGNVDATTSELLNNPKFGILLDVWKRANLDFYYKNNVNQDELVYGAVKGLVDKLGDQYTVFEEPSEALGLQQYLQGEFEGIGTVIDIIDNKIVIMKTLPGSPAEKANLQTGDVIQKIDYKSVDNISVNEVLNLIRGDAGTVVHLTILRNTQTLEIDLTRALITIASVSGKMVGGVAEISVTEFTQDSATEFTNTLNELNKQSPKGYVLDLRGNPGGYLDSSVQMLGHFIEKDKTVVSTKTAAGTTSNFASAGPAELKGKPLVVLVDDGTASAAEIMAGAIQDYKIGKLVGSKTYGKGSVQEITDYSDDSLLKITVAHWLTPNGRDVNGVGIIPDIDVALDQALLLKGTDNQLQKALDTVNAM